MDKMDELAKRAVELVRINRKKYPKDGLTPKQKADKAQKARRDKLKNKFGIEFFDDDAEATDAEVIDKSGKFNSTNKKTFGPTPKYRKNFDKIFKK